MSSRLSAIDASFWFMEHPSTPMHAGGVAVFELPAAGFDHEQLVRLVRQRIALVPRYRQRVREVPFGFARPVWVDDEHFDVAFHVRRTAVAKPGSEEQLDELVARLMSRPLDRTRPLWEMYLIEGLADGRFAIVTKSHQALVDGISAVDIAQVLLDEQPDVPGTPVDTWRAEREPSEIELTSQAVTELLTRPAVAVDAARTAITDVSRTAGAVAERATGIVAAALAIARPSVPSPLNVSIGRHRLFRTVDLSLDDFRTVRARLGGTVHDAMLSVIAGGLRSWLLARGTGVQQGDRLRVLLPMSIEVPAAASGQAGGSRVSANVVDLPIGEADPAVRLQQIGYQLAQLEQGGHFVAAEDIAGIAGFGPPTLHALGARLTSGFASKVYNLVVTNVPGPQRPLYAAGARMLAAYPVVPLTANQALSIGVTSYDGGVYLGLYADRDALPDVELIAECMRSSMDELISRAAAHKHAGLRVVRDARTGMDPAAGSVSRGSRELA